MKNQLVIDIKGNSLDDGSGIRTVIFLKGCPLRCVWCHNPESKDSNYQLSFDPDICVDCGKCRKTCKMGALSKENEFYIDRNKCNECLDCVNNCPSGALSVVGKTYTDEELLDIVLKDKPFFDASNGGVTLSGGEPTFNLEYFSHIAKMFHDKGIDVQVETCGMFNYDEFVKKALPYVDHIYFDIKIFDENEHKKYCGISNKVILENFSKLNKLLGNNPDKLLARTPLIPGITATEKNLNEISDFLLENGVKESFLLPYNPLWLKKNFKIGVSTTMKLPDKFMPNADVNKCKEIYRKKGIKVE